MICPYFDKSEQVFVSCTCPEMDHKIITHFSTGAAMRQQMELYCNGLEDTRRYCEVYDTIERVKRRKENPLLPTARPKSVDEILGFNPHIKVRATVRNGKMTTTSERKRRPRGRRTQVPTGAQNGAHERRDARAPGHAGSADQSPAEPPA